MPNPARNAERSGSSGALARILLPLALMLAASALAACSKEDAPASEASPAAEPVAVLLHRAGTANEGEAIRAPGTVRLRNETPLAFWTVGRVASVAVRQGDRVVAGRELARLDTRTLDMDVRAARADAERAREELARQKKLLAQGWVPRARVDAAAAAGGAADAALERALFAQRNARILAPADGIVLQRLAEPGQTVGAGEPVLVIGEYRSGHVVRVPLVAADAARVRPGMPVEVQFPDGSAPPTLGRLIEIAGRADERTGTFQVEVALPPNPALKSGLLAEVRMVVDPQGEGPIIVPATALFGARAGEAFVWKYDPATRQVKPAQVRTGAVHAAGVAISSGLSAGDLIVRSGVDRLTTGQSVVPLRPGQAANS